MTNALTPLNVALAVLLAAAIVSRWGPQLRGDWIVVAIVGLLIGGAAGAAVTAAFLLAPPAKSAPPKPPAPSPPADQKPAPKPDASVHGANADPAKRDRDPDAGLKGIAAALEDGMNKIDGSLKNGLAAAPQKWADPTAVRDPDVGAIKEALGRLDGDVKAGFESLRDVLKAGLARPSTDLGARAAGRAAIGADSEDRPAATVRIVQAAFGRGPSGARVLWLPLRADRRAAIRTGQVTFCAGLASDAAGRGCADGPPNPGCTQNFICPSENFVVGESGAPRKFVSVPAALLAGPLIARLVLTGDPGVVACQLAAEARPPGRSLALVADSADCIPQKGNAG